MKESYSEDLASHTDPELYAGDGNIAGVATAGAHAGQVLSSEKRILPCADPFRIVGRQHRVWRNWRAKHGHGGVEDPVHVWKLQAREPGDPIGFRQVRNGQKTPRVDS